MSRSCCSCIGSLKPEKFCCCISPKFGGLIIGCMGIVFGLFAIYGGITGWQFPMQRMFLPVHIGSFKISFTSIGVPAPIIFAVFLCGVFSKKTFLMIPAFVWLYAAALSYTLAILYWSLTFVIIFIYTGHGHFMPTDDILTVSCVLLVWAFLLCITTFSMTLVQYNDDVAEQGIVYHKVEEPLNPNQVEVSIASDSTNENKVNSAV